MVSIIIPAYNVEKYIERCIRSAMNQTLKNIEIIVINDGSKDKTQKIIESLQVEDNRIKLVNKKNGGLSSARNRGIIEAKGEYIQHLDGDDWIEKETCEELYKLAKKEDLDIVISDFYKDYDNGKLVKIKSFKFEENIILNSNICLKELSENNINVNIWMKFIKKEIYIKNNIQHLEGINLGEDLVTTPKLIGVSNRIMKKNKAYYHYIYNPKSITNNKFSQKIGEIFICFDELEKFFKDRKIENYQLKILKANHLSNFFYNTPLKEKKYMHSFDKFSNYIESLENEILNELRKEKKLLYKIFSVVKHKYLRIKLIVLFSKLRKMRASLERGI